MCFHINSKSPHADQFVKSWILNKCIGSILSIDTFEQQNVLIKCILQSPRFEDHMKTIGIDQSLCTRSCFEHKYMNNIKKIYQHAGKCYDQQNLKDILDAAMVSPTDGVTDNIPNVPMTSTRIKKPSAWKSLCLLTNTLDVKRKTAERRIVDSKSKRRAMKVGTIQWTKKTRRKVNSKIN